tara:strand:- start:1011 stop:1964 length:954 start_codon:yes stop_codon:yes gene_type:complete
MKKREFLNIAVIRDDRLGDTILTLPIMRKLKDDYPKSRLTMVISAISKDLIQMIDFIDEFMVSDNTIETINKINSKNFDLILNFSPFKGKSYKFFLRAKWKVNIFYSSRYKKKLNKYKLFFFNSFFDKNYVNQRNNLKNLTHQTLFMNKVLEFEGISLSGQPKEIFLNLNNKLKFDYFIHLSNRWINSEYFGNDLISLIEAISNKSDKISFSTDLILSNEMKKVIDMIISNFNYTLNLKPKFENWINLIDQSKFIITPECGCSHICGLLNKKAVIIYDRNNKANFIKKEYHPYLSKKVIQIDSEIGEKLNRKILSYI